MRLSVWPRPSRCSLLLLACVEVWSTPSSTWPSWCLSRQGCVRHECCSGAHPKVHIVKWLGRRVVAATTQVRLLVWTFWARWRGRFSSVSLSWQSDVLSHGRATDCLFLEGDEGARAAQAPTPESPTPSAQVLCLELLWDMSHCSHLLCVASCGGRPRGHRHSGCCSCRCPSAWCAACASP